MYRCYLDSTVIRLTALLLLDDCRTMHEYKESLILQQNKTYLLFVTTTCY